MARGPKPGAGVTGGAEVGRLGGRVGSVVNAAYRLQRMAGRPQNRAAMDESELAIAIGAIRAALRDLEAEAQGRAQQD